MIRFAQYCLPSALRKVFFFWKIFVLTRKKPFKDTEKKKTSEAVELYFGAHVMHQIG